MLFLVVFWMIAAAFIVIFEGALTDFKAPAGQLSYSFSRDLQIVLVFTFFAAVIVAAIDVFFVSNFFRRKTFGFILQVSEKFEKGVLLHFLVGKYHRPRGGIPDFYVSGLKIIHATC